MIRDSCVVIVLLSLIESGCISTPQAPGTAQVKITRNVAEVTGCTPRGNINFTAGGEPRNQAVGLGGNVVFDTTPSVGTAMGDWTTGIVYHCASITTTAVK
jgi:hypothetical protein